ncbi:hypothetical protein V6N13_110482 [Hibiscus sabdariffa]
MLNRLEAKIAEDPHYLKRILKLHYKEGEVERLKVDWETRRKQHHVINEEKKFDSWEEQGHNLQTIKDGVCENFGITDALLQTNVQLGKEAIMIQELKEQSNSTANMFDEMFLDPNLVVLIAASISKKNGVTQGMKGVGEEDVKIIIDKARFLSSYLQGKDVFEKY